MVDLFSAVADYEERFGELDITLLYLSDEQKTQLIEDMQGALSGRRPEIDVSEYEEDLPEGVKT